MSISLVAGLGNPGREYEKTRHNLGFVLIDHLAVRKKLAWKSPAGFEAQIARWDHPSGDTYLLAKPQTYMNESGRALQAIASFYKIPPSVTTVIFDDLTIDLGLVKVSQHGSAGGHNGLASILEKIGSGFNRYRLGIGPKSPPEIDLKDFVLGRFTPEQQTIVDQQLDTYLSGLELLLEKGAAQAMNQLNRRDQK